MSDIDLNDTVKLYTNDDGRKCYRNVHLCTPFKGLEFHFVENDIDDQLQFALHTNIGSLTVVDRMTGFGHRDIETGYRSPDSKFWLASGYYDVRLSGVETMQEAIEWVKERANTCVGI